MISRVPLYCNLRMQINSRFSLLTVLVVCQVSCDLIKVENLEKDDKDGLKFIGALVSYGDQVDATKAKKEYLGIPKLVCLEKNESVEIIPTISSAKKLQINLNVNFDFTSYETKDSFTETKYTIKSGRLCFFYGHFSPYEYTTDLKVSLYFTFVTTGIAIDPEKLLFVSAIITKPNVNFILFNNQERTELVTAKVYKTDWTKIKIDKFNCSTKDQAALNFAVSSKDFSINSEGTFDMVFVDEALRARATESAIGNKLNLMISTSDSSAACIPNVVEIMLTRHIIGELLIKRLMEEEAAKKEKLEKETKKEHLIV